MKTKGIWDDITSKPKWYAGIKNKKGNFHTAQSANRMKNKFKDGKLSDAVVETVLNHYGYFKKETEWETHSA